MRIGISTSVIQRGQTGVAQYLFALLRALRRYAHQHEFVLFALEEDWPLFGFAADSMRLVAVPEKFRPPIRNILWHQTELPKLVRHGGIDVLHIPSYRRLLWPRPCASVATIHDLAPFRVAGKYDRLRMFYGRVLARYLATRQDRLIAVSRNTARDMEAFWKISRRVSVVPNGIDHERFCRGDIKAARLKIQQRYHLDAPFFLYVARLEHPGKNHVRLIQAFEEFKLKLASPWKLALAGGDWHGAEVIHQTIASSPVSVDIQRLGFVPDADLPDLYRTAGAFVYPSLYEGFGMPPLEAMACGCPVIASPRGALAEVLGNACVLAEPLHAEEWTQQMARLAQDPKLRDRLRIDGLARAKCFNWEKTADATLKIYEEALAARARMFRCSPAPSILRGIKKAGL